jgi:transposase-like protein
MSGLGHQARQTPSGGCLEPRNQHAQVVTTARSHIPRGSQTAGSRPRQVVSLRCPQADPATERRKPCLCQVGAASARARRPLSYRDLEELLAERGIEVDRVTLYRWVQRFTPLLIDAARPVRHLAGDRWFVDETYVKVSGVWSYVYRAVDQHGQVIDVYVSQRRDIASARRSFTAALTVHGDMGEVVTDRAPALANVIEDLVPAALHNTGQYQNNRVECDHGRLKARLRPMRG